MSLENPANAFILQWVCSMSYMPHLETMLLHAKQMAQGLEISTCTSLWEIILFTHFMGFIIFYKEMGNPCSFLLLHIIHKRLLLYPWPGNELIYYILSAVSPSSILLSPLPEGKAPVQDSSPVQRSMWAHPYLRPIFDVMLVLTCFLQWGIQASSK